jgi:flavin reductase (DIM6/NTAB) family NADH-FMN oxidoreductase RutF
LTDSPIPGFHSYEPRNGHGLAHDPLNSIVAPRPIGWIASMDGQGRRNRAPYSFFNLFSYTPPIIGFCSNGWKDSVRNLEETGEFVWNLVTRKLAAAMNATSAPARHGVDEFELAGLTPAPSLKVKPPRVAESPVAFECRVTQRIRLANAAGEPVDSWLTLGEAVAIHIDRSLLENGAYNTVLAEPIARGGGPADYFSIGESQRFRMTRPVK